MLNPTLRKYINKNYYELLHDRSFLRSLQHENFVRPAVIPKANYLLSNFLIRKYINHPDSVLIHDKDFQKILFRVGFTYYTTSTTTTTTTTL
jgi:hypothetical protein